MKTARRLALAAACTPALFGLPAQAGRPMLVEDAGVEEPGAGHVEAWFERAPGQARNWTVAPAYAPVPGLELGAALARDTHGRQTVRQLQLKWQPGVSAEGRCQHALVAGFARPLRGGNAPWLNGAVSCRIGPGVLHLNLGAAKPAGGQPGATAGVAWEQDLGFATGHAEWLVARRARPVFNLGLRREIVRGLQIDGSLGRCEGRALFSAGLTLSF
ncbi:hypothetical protein [Ottowia sp.]|uniref:hypothetical protein n=1 Tax=Ottowia sp. TaxID=1898956 RepID=UPI0039E4DE71